MKPNRDVASRKPSVRISFVVLVFTISILFLTGCVSRQRTPGDRNITPEAQEILDYLAGKNTALHQFKGLGTFRRKDRKGTLSGRLAWACRRPDRFRTEILDSSGRPLVTIATDGQWFYARTREEGKIHKQSVKGATIERLTGTPVAIKVLIALLGGRIPIRTFKSAEVKLSDDHDPVLILKGRWNRPVERIYFHKTTRTCRRVVIYTDSGTPAYQVDLGARFEKNGYSFFRTIVIAAGKENRLELKMEKIWADVELPSSLFELENQRNF